LYVVVCAISCKKEKGEGDIRYSDIRIFVTLHFTLHTIYILYFIFILFQNIEYILTMPWKKDDDDYDNIMGRPMESEIPVEVKVRPEFGAGGALGRLLLLQSCSKKDTDTLELLEKQQQEQFSFDACSAIEKHHGVGYKKQNLVARPKDESLVFGVFKKKTRQEELKFPEPCVPPNLDPNLK
jgi:hypothetical protein